MATRLTCNMRVRFWRIGRLHAGSAVCRSRHGPARGVRGPGNLDRLPIEVLPRSCRSDWGRPFCICMQDRRARWTCIDTHKGVSSPRSYAVDMEVWQRGEESKAKPRFITSCGPQPILSADGGFNLCLLIGLQPLHVRPRHIYRSPRLLLLPKPQVDAALALT